MLLIVLSSILFGLAVAMGYWMVLAVIDRVNLRYRVYLEEQLRRLDMDTSLVTVYLRLWWAATLGTFLFIWLVLSMFPVAVLTALLIVRLVPLWLESRLLKRRQLIRDQLVPATRNLASRVRASGTLLEALNAISQEAPPPLGPLLRRAMTRCGQGSELKEVLLDLKEQVRIDAVSLFVIAIVVAMERGGPIREVLERLGNSLEELQRVERKRETDTAAGRLVVRVLALFPACFLGLYYLLDPDTTKVVFNVVAGQIVLCFVGILVYVSVRWAQVILARVE
jgi:tight adherence protein B